ncbi:MAG: hypothetical protein VKK97_03045 [Synechococcaceae cyanobacterium]|nr:hypothetical protein [Synechococcaceae cyanobacterium]
MARHARHRLTIQPPDGDPARLALVSASPGSGPGARAPTIRSAARRHPP